MPFVAETHRQLVDGNRTHRRKLQQSSGGAIVLRRGFRTGRRLLVTVTVSYLEWQGQECLTTEADIRRQINEWRHREGHGHRLEVSNWPAKRSDRRGDVAEYDRGVIIREMWFRTRSKSKADDGYWAGATPLKIYTIFQLFGSNSIVWRSMMNASTSMMTRPRLDIMFVV